MASSYRSAPGRLGADPGLCGSCAHERRVPSSRGGEFLLCARSAYDPRYPRYPVLPVVACAGHEPAARQADESGREESEA